MLMPRLAVRLRRSISAFARSSSVPSSSDMATALSRCAGAPKGGLNARAPRRQAPDRSGRAQREPGADVAHRVLEPIAANLRHDDEPIDARLARTRDELLAEWLEGGERDLERRAAGRDAQPGEVPYERRRRVDRQAEAVPAVRAEI